MTFNIEVTYIYAMGFETKATYPACSEAEADAIVKSVYALMKAYQSITSMVVSISVVRT